MAMQGLRSSYFPQVSFKAMLEQRAQISSILNRFQEETGLRLEEDIGQTKFMVSLCYSLAYPPSTRWLATLLKEVVRAIEDQGGECSDELMELVVETASKRAVLKDDQEEAFYSIYSINEKTIACRSLRMHNEVGTKIWGAGLFLSSLCINRSDLFANRRVIELGSGIGLTGLCLSTAKSPPRDIILSDYTVDTMNNLKHNLDLNRAAVSLGCSLTALRLDWTLYKDVTSQYYKNIAGKLGSVDVILAADCTYSPDICVDLTESIKSMLQASYNAIDMPRECCLYTTSDESLDEVMASTPSCLKAFPYALVASTLRNEETFQCFQAALRESNMIVDDITEWAVSAAGQSNYFYQSDVSVEVIKVFCLHLQSAIVSSCITR